MKKRLLSIVIFLLLLYFLVFPNETLNAARGGLDLWFGTLVPTLLPFLILSGFLIHSNLVNHLASLFHPLFGKLLYLSPEGSYVLFAGFLCGFPVGAKVLGDLVRNRKIHSEEAAYLLGFCNNVSPSFVITFFIMDKLNDSAYLLKALVLLYLFPLCYGILTGKNYRTWKKQMYELPIKNAPEVRLSFELMDACIYDAINTLLKLGGYVILFSVFATIPAAIPNMPVEITSALTGILEITNGVSVITQNFPKETSFRFLMPLISFGGLCALAQTLSVLKGSGLSAIPYVKAKLSTAVLVFFAAMLL